MDGGLGGGLGDGLGGSQLGAPGGGDGLGEGLGGGDGLGGGLAVGGGLGGDGGLGEASTQFAYPSVSHSLQVCSRYLDLDTKSWCFSSTNVFGVFKSVPM